MNEDSVLSDWEPLEIDGIELHHPSRWRVLRGELGAVVALRSPDASIEEFHANLNIVRRPASPPDLAALLHGQIAELMQLTDALIIDTGETELAQRPATRVLVTYRSDDDELTLEQWMVAVGASVLTISATSATSNHLAASEELDAMLASLVFHG